MSHQQSSRNCMTVDCTCMSQGWLMERAKPWNQELHRSAKNSARNQAPLGYGEKKCKVSENFHFCIVTGLSKTLMLISLLLMIFPVTFDLF